MNADIKKLAPIPDLMSFKRVLFVGPHPDDIEISSGGYVKKLMECHGEAAFLIVTDGGAGTNDPNISIKELIEIRRKEAFSGAKRLGVTDVTVLDIPDGGVYRREEMMKEIARKIIDYLPDAVFAPDPLLPTETHPDHINCGNAVNEAMVVSRFRYCASRHGIPVKKDQVIPKGVSLIYYYTHRPNAVVPIDSSHFQAKIDSILCHESQIDESFMVMRRYLEFKALAFGSQIGSEYGEGFFAMSPIHQHCFMESLS